MINGLTLNINPIKNLRTNSLFATKTDSFKGTTASKALDIIDSTVTIKEGELLDLSCVVDSSKPAALIEFTTTSEVSEPLDKSTTGSITSNLESLMSSNTDVSKNKDRTFKTEFSAKLRANAEDHGKVLTCKADNGFSNQKWESKKVLNILCKNQSLFSAVQIKILEANKTYYTFYSQTDL